MSVHDIVNHPYFTLTSWIIGTAGLIASLLAIRRKRLCYDTVESGIVSESSASFSKLRVQYGKKEIPFLYACVLTLWNRGSAVIEKKDIATAAPLQLSLGGAGDILECFLDAQSRPGNNFRLRRSAIDPNTYDIAFDYIAQGNGCRIVVLHTSREMHRIHLLGEIIGGSEIKVHQPTRLDSLLVLLLVTISFCGSIALGAVWVRHQAGVARASNQIDKANHYFALADLFIGIVATALCVMVVVGLTLFVKSRLGRLRITAAPENS